MILAALLNEPNVATKKPVTNGATEASTRPALKQKPAPVPRNRRWIQFRKIDWKATEDAVVEEAEYRQQQQHTRVCLRDEIGDREHDQTAEAHQSEYGPSAEAIG